MEARAAVRACVPTDRQAFVDHDPTATTGLRGIRWIDSNDPATGACCLVPQDDEESAPSRVSNGLRQMVILHHIDGLQVLMIDRVVLAYQRQRRLVVKVRSLPPHFLMRLGKER